MPLQQAFDRAKGVQQAQVLPPAIQVEPFKRYLGKNATSKHQQDSLS